VLAGGRSAPRLSRVCHAIALVALLLELLALPIGGLGAILRGLPNTPVVLYLILAALGVLLSMLLWGAFAFFGSGLIEGLRGGGRKVAFGPTRARRGPVDGLFRFVRRWATKPHDALKGAGYGYGSLLAVAAFVAVIVVDVVTEFGATDVRVDLFGGAVVLLLSGLVLPSLVLLSVGLLEPDRLPGDTSGTAAAALREARADRTEVEGVASAVGPLLQDPGGEEVLAYRLRGSVGGHEVDDGDAIPFGLTDEDGREGRVEADGPVLVAFEEGGERVAASELDPVFLRQRGLRGSGTLTIHRLRPGDRVRVSADFDRAVGGAGYRDSVSMVLRAGDEPLLLEDSR